MYLDKSEMTWYNIRGKNCHKEGMICLICKKIRYRRSIKL